MAENVSGHMWNTAQLRGARALLGWSQRKMAHETGLPLSVVQRGEAPVSARNIDSNDFMRCIESAFVQSQAARVAKPCSHTWRAFA